MFRKRLQFASAVIVCWAIPVFAGPADLLKQAIEENEGAPPPATAEIKKIITEADRLADQRKFNEAISLYEKAYRMAPTNRANYVRLLVAKRAAGVMTAKDSEALELIQEQQAAEVAQVFRHVRLNVIQARQALRSDDIHVGRQMMKAAYAALDGLPAYVDAEPYRRKVRALENAINRRTVREDRRTRAADPAGSQVVVTRKLDDDDKDPGRAVSMMDADPEAMDEYAEHAETGEIIDVQESLDDEYARYVYETDLATALSQRRGQIFIHNTEAAMPFEGLTFPQDWPERSSRRARYRDGAIYEGRPYTGQDGQTYQTVIYDLGDLVHPVPNFYADYPGTARRQRMEEEDRFYLRERSMIFNGYPEDLAAGMPLLHFFGGIDNHAISTRTDGREVDRIMRILDRFIANQ